MNRIKSILPVLISACLLLLLSFGYRAGFGLFLAPMSAANGWGRDVFSLALAVQNLAWGLFAVFAGGLADRHGILKVLLAGAACYGLGMWLMADSTSGWAITSTAGLMVGAGVAGTAFGIVLPALARAVPEQRRAWALGIGTAAGSLGQFLLVPVMQQLIDWAGWYQALQFLGLSAILMSFCAIALVRYSAAPADGTDETALAKISLPELARRAFQVPSYTLLVFGFFVCGFHVAFITVHMPGYLVDLGFDPKVGAWSISLIGLCNVIGAYMAGVISSRYPMHKLLSLIYLGRVIAIAGFLAFPVTLASVLVFSASMGFLWLATVPPTSGLVARFFGTRYMTFLYGIVFFSHQLGSFSGVWLGGFLYETFGNYDGIWYAGILLGIVAAGLHWPIADRDHSPRLQVA
ncbi:MFS transporter [Microbulbifer marinus]|uniref:Predicted arabinose efflux permease, MFS family n=1 Tax=Microbulbifer marinus TaxID=658218 RepID=A0A1H3WWL3_9GAMM|nr:MFS transporter [Microbulbifer marinus]SDZ91556.1 Predicted arabinose efflux permease, MFS family [Microbulbifer marinus]